MKKIDKIRQDRQQRIRREEELGELNRIVFKEHSLMPKENPKEAWNHFVDSTFPLLRRLDVAQKLVLKGLEAKLAWKMSMDKHEEEPSFDENLINEWDCARLGTGNVDLTLFTRWFDEVCRKRNYDASQRKVDFVSDVFCSPVSQNRSRGNGLVANVDVEGGDVILDIPRVAIISSDMDDLCRNSVDLNKTWRDIPSHLNVPLSPSAASLYDDRRKGFERLMAEIAKNGSNSLNLVLRLLWESALPMSCSLYAPYLNILPMTYNVPIFWTMEELQALADLNFGLTAARVAGDFLSHLRQYSRVFDLLFQQDPNQRAIPLSLMTWSRFKWALGVAMTRKNPVPSKNFQKTQEMALAFLPGFDLSNHDYRGKDTHNDCIYSIPTDSIQVYSQRNVAKGSQVFIRYDIDRPTELCDFLGTDVESSRENPPFTTVRSFAAWLANGGFVPDLERFVYGPLPPLEDGFHPSDNLLIRVSAPPKHKDASAKSHRLMVQIMQRLRFSNSMTVALGRPMIWATSAPLLGFLRITQSTSQELEKFDALVTNDLEEMQRDGYSKKFAFGRCFVPLSLGVACEQRVLKWLRNRCELMIKHSVNTLAHQGARQDEEEDDKSTLDHLKQPPSVSRDVCFVAWRDRKLLRGVMKEIDLFLDPETGVQHMKRVFEGLNVNPAIANDITFD
jgi:hypothetical protein